MVSFPVLLPLMAAPYDVVGSRYQGHYRGRQCHFPVTSLSDTDCLPDKLLYIVGKSCVLQKHMSVVHLG